MEGTFPWAGNAITMFRTTGGEPSGGIGTAACASTAARSAAVTGCAPAATGRTPPTMAIAATVNVRPTRMTSPRMIT